MIAPAKTLSKHLARRPKTPAVRTARRRAKPDAWSRDELLRRRESLFSRAIDYIPCRQFLRADAEAQATTPPADAAVPLEQRDGPPADAKGLTPYLASLRVG